MRYLALMLLLLSSLLAHAQFAPEDCQSEYYKLQRLAQQPRLFRAQGVQISAPRGWQDNYPEGKEDMILNVDDYKGASINVVVAENRVYRALDAHALSPQGVFYQQSELEDTSVVVQESINTRLAGEPALFVRYKRKLREGKWIVYEQTLVLRKGKMYLLSMGAPELTAVCYRKLFAEVRNSFGWLE